VTVADQFDPLQADVLPPDAKPGGEPAPQDSFRGRSTDTSLRESLDKAFADEAPEGSPAKTPASKDGAGEPPGTAPETAPGSRPRRADGKFAKADEAAPPVEVPKFADQKVETPDEQRAKAPASWKPEKAALWDKIQDPDARAYIHEREQQLQEGFQRAAQVRQVAESVLNEFTPYQEILQQENATPATAIRALLQTAYALRTSQPEYRKALFVQLAQQYGVDLGQPINPDLARAQADADRLRMSQMEQTAFQQTQQEMAIAAQVEAFAAQHEFFPHVREIMGRLLKGGVAPDLETAYQQAVQIHPEVRAALEQRNVAAARQQQEEAARQRAARATAGGSAPGGGAMAIRQQGQPQAPGRFRNAADLRSDIEAAFDSANRGG
jgi:hypothetical protein